MRLDQFKVNKRLKRWKKFLNRNIYEPRTEEEIFRDEFDKDEPEVRCCSNCKFISWEGSSWCSINWSCTCKSKRRGNVTYRYDRATKCPTWKKETK